jgi:hypothetical protein
MNFKLYPDGYREVTVPAGGNSFPGLHKRGVLNLLFYFYRQDNESKLPILRSFFKSLFIGVSPGIPLQEIRQRQ